MKNSTIKWHLARDNQIELHKFLDKNSIKREVGGVYDVTVDYRTKEVEKYYVMLWTLDNGATVTTELRAGDDKSYSIADHFQVVDYTFGGCVLCNKKAYSEHSNVCTDCSAGIPL
jgi:hypothetical protein